MKIQNRLTLAFSSIFGLILLSFIVVMFQYYQKQSVKDYFDRLHLKATVKVDMIDGETIDPDILHLIDDNMPVAMEPQVTIWNECGGLVYWDRSHLPDAERQFLFDKLDETNLYNTWFGQMQICAFTRQGEKCQYKVIAMGTDVAGIARRKAMRNAFAISFVVTLLALIIALRVLARQAFAPVSHMIDEVSAITDLHDYTPINEGNGKDELAKLAVTFNNMLAQLKQSFDAQRQFVYNISHELRTPLSAIIAELELTKQECKSEDDYKRAVDSVLGDSRRIVKLSNDLLDLAKANYAPADIAMHNVRIDEILLEACCKEQKAHPDYNIHLNFDADMIDDSMVTVRGNEYLLGVAFANLLDNACKFSEDKACEVNISQKGDNVVLDFIDKGIGINAEDQKKLFTPFFRGANHTFADGNGIGLSLTHKIIELHQGNISFTSQPGATDFSISLNSKLAQNESVS
jgi:signal transduction histidine kinase